MSSASIFASRVVWIEKDWLYYTTAQYSLPSLWQHFYGCRGVKELSKQEVFIVRQDALARYDHPKGGMFVGEALPCLAKVQLEVC
jgi:hypothetical protein